MPAPVTTLSKRFRPYLRVVAVIVLAALAVFTAARIYSWHRYGARTRLLTLVNAWNPASETGFAPKLTEAEDGFRVDKDCADALRRMLADCRGAGCRAQLAGAYRSMDDQLVLHDAEAQRLVDSGLSPEEAETRVARLIAEAGRSEHQLGLAVDIVDGDNPVLDETQASTPTARWLQENAWKYGFIQRYPRNAEGITGYDWHPWHYRYVGENVASDIYSLGITLEEYLSLFYRDEAQVVYDGK